MLGSCLSPRLPSPRRESRIGSQASLLQFEDVPTVELCFPLDSLESMSTAGHRRATLVKLLPPASIWSNSGQIKEDLIRSDDLKGDVEDDAQPQTCWSMWASDVNGAVSVVDLRSRYEGDLHASADSGQFKRKGGRCPRDDRPYNDTRGEEQWSSGHESDRGEDELSRASTPLILQISQRTPQKIWSEIEINDLRLQDDSDLDYGKFARSSSVKKNSTPDHSVRRSSDHAPVKFCKLGLHQGKVQVVQTASCKCFRRERDESPVQFRMRVKRLLEF